MTKFAARPSRSRSGERGVPDGRGAATAAVSFRTGAYQAARFAGVRGDLWSEAAFTYAAALWARTPRGGDAQTVATEAHAIIERALAYAPHDSGVWLLAASLALQSERPSSDPTSLLKMSYYTGPSERSLIPLRLLIAARSDALENMEVQQFIRRDLRYLFGLRQTSAVAEAYASASPGGKRFLEQAIDDIDPAYRAALPAGAQKSPAK